MDRKKIEKIKGAILTNFEDSPDLYLNFEDRWGFFGLLTSNLISRLSFPTGAKILDIGCGTGASCQQMLTAAPTSRVWGLDLSPAMLEAARHRTAGNERLTLVEGDAARLTEYFDFHYDIILYTASIFLIPDYEESLRQAKDLLEENGAVGFTFMDGVYDAQGNNLLALADLSAGEGVSLRKPVRLDECRFLFGELFPFTESWAEDFQLPQDLLRQFFSIPAMSAGLFPGVPYCERVKKVGRLFDHLPESCPLFKWHYVVGKVRN